MVVQKNNPGNETSLNGLWEYRRVIGYDNIGSPIRKSLFFRASGMPSAIEIREKLRKENL